jgi:hypothetical protein
LPAKVNSDGIKALQTTVHDTVRWVDAIAAEPEQSGTHLQKLRDRLVGEGSQRSP